MAMDINMVAQIKEGGKWKTVAYDLEEGRRDRQLFGLLAGAGGIIRPIKEPIGLPSDFETFQEGGGLYTPSNTWGYYMGDWRHSSYTLDELLTFYVKNRKKKLEGMYGLRRLIAKMIIIESQVEDEDYSDSEVRIVFGFDN